MKSILLLLISLLTITASSQVIKIVKNEKLSLTGYADGLRTVWFSSDNSILYGDFNHLLKWNIQSGKIVQKIELPGYNTHQSCISPDGSLWVQGNSNYNDPSKKDITDMHSNLNTYGFAYDQLASRRLNDFNISSTAFIQGRDYQVLAIESDRKTYTNSLHIFSLKDYKNLVEVAKAKNSSDVMSCVDVTEDGKFAVVGYAGKESRVEIYDLINVKLLSTIKTSGEISKIQVKQGTIAASGVSKVHIIDLESKKLLKTIATEAPTFALALSPNGKTVAVGGRVGGADLIDVETGKIDHFYTGQCQSLAFDSKGNMLAVGVFKTLHTPEIPSAFIYFNENKKDALPPTEEVSTDGWVAYSHPSPTFRINLPATPETKESVNKNGVKQISIKSIGKNEGSIVNVSAIEVKDKKVVDFITKTNNSFLEKMEQSLDKIEIKNVSVNQGKAQDFSFIKKGYHYICRTIYFEGHLYQLIYFENDKLDSGNSKKLFDSLTL